MGSARRIPGFEDSVLKDLSALYLTEEKSEDIVSDSAAKNILSIYRRHADAFASQRSRTLFEKS